MVLESIPYFFSGVATSLALSSPAEWAIHRYILHPKKRNWINRKSAEGHHDNHHNAYKGPAHYYRDSTNHLEVIHFTKLDVAKITGLAATAGFVIDRAYSALIQQPGFELKNAAFVAGTVAGTLMSYGSYEFSHHYMHVIGQRRHSINKTLGDIIQSEPDEKLRFSKPLLDDICNAVELHVDKYVGTSQSQFPFNDSLTDRLYEQIDYNREKANVQVSMPKTDDKNRQDTTRQITQQILTDLTSKVLQREKEYRESLSSFKKISYWISRKVQKTLRASPVFKFLDNNHFVHHTSWYKNLNVASIGMDYLVKTKIDSSVANLEANKRYWLCPNSAETKKFVPIKKTPVKV